MATSQHRGFGAGLALALGALLGPGAARAAEPAEPVALSGPVAAVEGEFVPLDVDVYTVNVAAGQQLFVALFDAKDGAFTDTRLSVSLGGAILATDDDGGDGFLSRIALEASAGGLYEIRVSGFRDQAFDGGHAEGAAQPAPYRLVVGVGTPPLAGESEPNDTAVDADTLATGSLLRGTLGALDVDRYATSIPGGDALAVSLFPLDPVTGAPQRSAELADTRLGLFDGGAAPFAEDDDGGPGLFSNLARNAPAAATQLGIGVTGFRDTGYAGAHPEGPFDYVILAARFAPATASVPCDSVAPLGRIDRADIDAIFAARNTPASGAGDPRDFDGDGTITVLDGSQCKERCTFARCGTAPCGLLGAEPLVVLGLLAAVRRRRARARHEAEASR
jgi:hypothetical protein